LLIPILTQANAVREVVSVSDSLITIHTTLGYSTILEFQEKPVSSILGDQDAFKLEYVGNSITLKPLFANAHSNLFVYTGFERFNFSLVTSPLSNTDYVVRITKSGGEKSPQSEPHTEKSPYLLIQINQKSSKDDFTLKVDEIDLARDSSDPRSASLIKFNLASSGDTYKFIPASLGVKQSGQFLDIESIYLDRTETSKNLAPVNGVIALLNQQWKRNDNLTLVFAFDRKAKNKSHPNKLSITFSPTKRSLKKENSNGKTGNFPLPHP